MRTSFSELFAARLTEALEKAGTREGALRGWETRRGRAPVERKKKGRRRRKKGKPELPGRESGPRETHPRMGHGRIKRYVRNMSRTVELPDEHSTIDERWRWDERQVLRDRAARHARELQQEGPPTAEMVARSQRAEENIDRIGREAIRKTRLPAGREYGFVVDNETGAPVGPFVQGLTDSVETTASIAALEAGRGYTHVHTHPTSASFSPEDVILLTQFPQLTHIRVYGADGHLYEMSKPPGWEPWGDYVEPRLIASEWNAFNRHLMDKYHPGDFREGETQEEWDQRARVAWQGHSHEIVEILARVMGLKYRRTSFEGPEAAGMSEAEERVGKAIPDAPSEDEPPTKAEREAARHIPDNLHLDDRPVAKHPYRAGDK